VNETLDFVKSAETSGHNVRYPGERVLKIRQDSLDNGIAIDTSIWDEIKAF
jgi:LDH2 family malate/lactate/ureidoglycolate dehydrogenase